MQSSPLVWKDPIRYAHVVLPAMLALLILASCKPPEQQKTDTVSEQPAADTSAGLPTTTDALDEDTQYMPPELHEVIDYPGQWGAISDSAYAFEPFAKLSAVVVEFIRQKDSLRTVSADVFEQHEKNVHATIMDYKRDIESGKYAHGTFDSLLNLPRTLGAEDSSFAFLPECRPSFFTNSNFFFLGGAPFIDRMQEYDTVTHQEIIFKDANGKPELHFKATYTENKYLLLKSIMQFKRPRLKISFGGPVSAYDAPPDEVKGIGSVIHTFVDEIPVFFLMENGVVPGLLKYYDVPFTAQYACYSEYPYLVFSCSAIVDTNGIVGIYIPYDNYVAPTCSVSRPDRWNWSADLNNDNIPDIACVIGTYEGVEQGVLEMLWFVNLNGTWKIVDYGAVPSCT